LEVIMLALLQLVLALPMGPALPSACSVLSKGEAQAYVGERIARMLPEEPEPDPETGSIHTTCTYMGEGRALVISIDEFKTPEAARKKMTAEYLKAQDTRDDDDGPPKIEPESALGDQAFYGQSAHAAMILMVKGARAYGAVLGGTPPKPADRAALRKLVMALAAKV
jgi:hypothetical protein